MAEHSELAVRQSLERKGVKFTQEKIAGKMRNIIEMKHAVNIGIKSLGRIDFLLNYCGYWK